METLKRLAHGACPTAEDDVFTATTDTAVTKIDCALPSSASGDETVYVLLDDVLLFDVTLQPGGSVSWHGPQMIETGEMIKIQASDAAVSHYITGVEIT